MSKQPPLKSLIASWKGLPRLTRWCVAILAIAMLALVVWQSNSAGETSYASLFDGASFSSQELQRMKLAFAQDNLSDFHVDQGRLLVPRSRWADYLQALVEHDAVPEKFKSRSLAPPNVNLFATRWQQEQLDLHQRKQSLCDLIVMLPYVESALVDLDVIESQSPYGPRQYSCIISVQPRSNRMLHDDEVESIRRIVQGAVAGAVPERIYVTDLNCGMTHDPNWSTAEQLSSEPVRWRTLQAQLELRERIQAELANYGPIDLSVQPAPTDRIRQRRNRELESQVAGAASSNGQVDPLVPPSSLPVAGTNSQASVRSLTPAGSNDSREGRMAQSHSASYRHDAPPHFAVSLSIPQATLQQYWRTTQPSAESPPDRWTADDAQLAFDRLRLELVKKIRPLLPGDDATADESISIALVGLTTHDRSPSGWGELWSPFRGGQGGAILAVTSSLILAAFLMITTMRRSRRSSEAARPAVVESPIHNPRMAEIRQQIDQLIQNDPDTAARVIQQWIRRSN